MIGKRVERGRFHSHAFLVSIGRRRKGTGGREEDRKREQREGGRGLSDGGFAPRPLPGQISGGWKALKVIVVMNWQQVN